MATYYNLPVYKQSYDLLLDIFKLTKEFNREYRVTGAAVRLAQAISTLDITTTLQPTP